MIEKEQNASFIGFADTVILAVKTQKNHPFLWQIQNMWEINIIEKTAKERKAERSVEVIRALQMKESHLGIV